MFIVHSGGNLAILFFGGGGAVSKAHIPIGVLGVCLPQKI